ncbi:MAG: FAD-binding oxidoreductase [Candidatus Vogelbacteria bacterium CG22_combo_CG10-13_8_21_14_all_37_9]|uniref:D-lactate dehydrogenase (cytochrome) n=1 Tax=Candidatus Vogelbacteria bacterium CG22_combo_CG10-13_8_21_14_all_37_9 TaxID=1975046 RepID=A0A2H0BKB7_9BACT|nr:MAG: FAD-binding oxidoreductase [Candidatus Vogelbacteria bacterium CG22_combo_CG10-13_8_21_14_all_37_9]
MPESIFASLKPIFKGDLDSSPATLALYSYDASLFEIKPKLVVFPRSVADLKTLVAWVNQHRVEDPTLSLTARSAGTDMSGGAINASIIIDFTRYLNQIKNVSSTLATVEPGCFYRNFEKATLAKGGLMPTYPASRELCAVGGMVSNNSGGEKSLKYGKTEDHIASLKVIFSDANEYVVKPLTPDELAQKIAQTDFEGGVYRSLKKLIDDHYSEIKSAKPQVSKNSSGYYLWNVYDQTTDTFDLCRLIVGSQGTLALVTEITFKLVPVEPYSNLLTVFLPELSHISEMINEILPFGPDSIESYDDYSLKLAVKFFPDFFTQIGFWHSLRLAWQFLPEAFLVLLSRKLPKLILMVEFTGHEPKEIKEKIEALKAHLLKFNYPIKLARSSQEAEKYWRIRRESFNLLRKHTKGMRTAPFIEDIIVKPEFLPVFLPQVQKLIDDYKLVYTIAGHPGDGNFHIIPLMDLASPLSADVIVELSQKVYDLVLQYHGSISAEHNDGIIRTPYLLQMFGAPMVELFTQTKTIFDPNNIFNPGKKVGGTFADLRQAINTRPAK